METARGTDRVAQIIKGKGQFNVEWSKSETEVINRFFQSSLEHPISLTDHLIKDHEEKFLSYEPDEPDKRTIIKHGECALIFEYHNYADKAEISHGLDEITEKVRDRLKRLISKKRYEQLEKNVAGDAPISQTIDEELRGIIPDQSKITPEQKNISLAIIYGARALHWLLHNAPICCMMGNFNEDPSYNKFLRDYTGLNRLVQAKAGQKNKERRLDRKREIFDAIDQMHHDPDDPVPLKAVPLFNRLRNMNQVGYVYYERDSGCPGDVKKGCLYIIGDESGPIKFETFRQYVRDYKNRTIE